MPSRRPESPDPTVGSPDGTDPAPGAEVLPADEPRRGMLLMVLALPVILVVAVVVGGIIWSNVNSSSTEPLGLAAVPSPGGTGRYCTDLATALPATLGGAAKRTLIGAPDGSAAWGDPAIILRCGLPTPAELTCSSQLTQISGPNSLQGVLWLQRSEGGQTTYLAADRPVRIALTLPDGAGSGAIQELSAVISGVMPSTAQADGTLCKGGVLPTTTDN